MAECHVRSESRSEDGLAMSLWSRFINVFRSDALSREIGEEFEAHVADAIADGVDPVEARRRFGPAWSRLETSKDLRPDSLA